MSSSQQAPKSVSAYTQSVAESTASQVDVKLRANQTKVQLKQLFKNVDSEKHGKVKESAFFSLLKLHGVQLSAKDEAAVKKRFGNGGYIKYKDALPELTVDLLAA